MARGERLALMNVVENTRDFSGKENFSSSSTALENCTRRELLFPEHRACVLGIAQSSSCGIRHKSQGK